MMICSEDTDVASSVPTRIASYSVSLLDAGKSNRMACSILSLVGAFKLQTDFRSHLLRSAAYIKDPPANIILVHIPLGNFC